MELIVALLKSVSQTDCRVSNVCVGLHWTMVESKHAGMTHTYKTGKKIELRDAGNFIGMSALELAGRIKDWEPLEASLGLAAINSLIDPVGERSNVDDHILKTARGKTVTVIGRFPFNDEVVAAAKQTFLLEIEPAKNELPFFAVEEVIPKSDVVVVSATALINKSMQRLLELSKGKECIVLGPSTPMNDVLLKFGASVTAGVRIVEPTALAASIMQGAKSFRKLAGIESIVQFR
ncbi:MAG: DUF364 domain-containing protein [Candidatus Eisenbacteria bacterium]|nr:DUF364 domain-containing protein [Candidatus Eisenbacteria bacterium]